MKMLAQTRDRYKIGREYFSSDIRQFDHRLMHEGKEVEGTKEEELFESWDSAAILDPNSHRTSLICDHQSH